MVVEHAEKYDPGCVAALFPMKHLAQIIKWSLRSETIHVFGVQKLE